MQKQVNCNLNVKEGEKNDSGVAHDTCSDWDIFSNSLAVWLALEHHDATGFWLESDYLLAGIQTSVNCGDFIRQYAGSR